ncbi:hypothetical protein [Desulfitobacterium hafniense]|uniref:Uncharacterized protein n=1 Tax=Desulfitobacterium hafniense (strain Y51) TaxID=138119 RepID=Q24T58_DESHY|nr:hypothetical protein [Desulfitobacterium hafniense]BAE84784.1 hypothetical protein DSY2995 [Desulfitobacterium hafniense Y51]
MTTEEFQKLVLEKLAGLEQGQSKLGEGQVKLEQRQAKLEEGQVKLEQRQAKLEEGQVKLEQRQAKLEEGQVKLEQRQAKLEEGQVKLEERQVKLEKRIDEVESTLTAKIDALDAKVERYGQSQQDDVKGLLEVMNKKLDHISAVQTIQGESINILALRQLQTESELAALKKAL